MLAIDDQGGIGQQRRAILVHQLGTAGGGRDESKRPAPAGGGNPGEVFRQAQHRGHARPVRERALEPRIVLRHDDDVFVGGAGQRAPDIRVHEPGAPFRAQPGVNFHRALLHQRLEPRGILGADREAGKPCRAGRSADRLGEVARNGHIDEQRGGALGDGALQRAVEPRGLLKSIRPWRGLNEDELAFDVAAGKIELGAVSGPHEVEVQPRGGRRGSALCREGGREAQRRAASACADLPIGRHILRSKRDRLETDILQAPFAKLGGHQFVNLFVRVGAGNPAPGTCGPGHDPFGKWR